MLTGQRLNTDCRFSHRYKNGGYVVNFVNRDGIAMFFTQFRLYENEKKKNINNLKVFKDANAVHTHTTSIIDTGI